jgi:hypothetical protein
MKQMLKLAIVSLSLSLASVETSAQTSQPEWIPESLRAPPGNELFLQALAVGVQIYDCQATKSGFEWVFHSPKAILFNGSALLLGTHFAGPTWQSLDGSRVTGARVASADASNPSSIPWLLLRASSHDGTGMFSNVTYIQRLLTGGGTAPPAEACDEAHLGEEARSSYIAAYYFYVEAK